MWDVDAGVVSGFDAAAHRYNLMVALNPGYQRHLRLAAETLLDSIDVPAPVLLDLGCGSGLSTLQLQRAAHRRGLRPTIIGVDASAGMLEQARARDWRPGVSFVQGRGEHLTDLGLPVADGVLACYLLRNVPDLPATLTGVRSVLRPGSMFVAEDYSVRDNQAAAARWSLVNRLIIDPLGKWIGGDAELYRYLHRSVNDFMGITELATAFHTAGFTDVATRTVGGWQRDILHLVRGVA